MDFYLKHFLCQHHQKLKNILSSNSNENLVVTDIDHQLLIFQLISPHSSLTCKMRGDWNHTHHPPTPSPTSKHSTLPRNPTLLPRFPLSSSGNHSLIHSSIDSNHCSPSLTFVLTCEEIGVICLEV